MTRDLAELNLKPDNDINLLLQHPSNHIFNEVNENLLKSKRCLLDPTNLDFKRPKLDESKRFVGRTVTTGYANRPLAKNLSYGTLLTISKNPTPKAAWKFKKVNQNETSLRILISDGESKLREIGRLPSNVAKLIHPLIDDLELTFKVLLNENIDKLSTGDTFKITVDVYLDTNKIQDESGTAVDYDHVITSLKGGAIQESPKSIAVVELFNTLRLRPLPNPFKNSLHRNAQVVINLEDSDEEVVEVGPAREVLSIAQVHSFYKETQTAANTKFLPELDTPANMKIDLKTHQKQGLVWMLQREKEHELVRTLLLPNRSDNFEETLLQSERGILNPMWSKYKWPKEKLFFDGPVPNSSPDSFGEEYFYFNNFTCKFSLVEPLIKENCKSGILADEMGLGKTISTLALIHSCPQDPKATFDFKSDYAYKTTLVVCPKSVLTQWNEEWLFVTKKLLQLCSHIYFSDSRQDLRTFLAKGKTPPTIVFTTFGTALHEWTLNKQGGLFSVKFFRVVIDEGHIVRNRSTKTAAACSELRAERRWALTGTPIVNSLDDIYGLLRFLKVEPWSMHSFWSSFVSAPFERKEIEQALNTVELILDPILLRRTKSMKSKNGSPLVDLPEKEVVIENVAFTTEERKVYSYFLRLAEVDVKEGIKNADILSRYTTILTHILRLRQCCCHYSITGMAETPVAVEDENFNNLNAAEDIKSDFAQKQDLPQDFKISGAQASKIEALKRHLAILKNLAPDSRTVVFSQFTTFLDLIGDSICGDYTVLKYYGSLSLDKRSEVLKSFGSSKPGVVVLLVSLKAGGVGLNLTQASTAFLMEPYWNVGMENQAIDRIHRLGQKLKVKVVRFILEHSIEEKMLKIQERKRKIGESIGEDENEKKQRRIEEIKTLFD